MSRTISNLMQHVLRKYALLRENQIAEGRADELGSRRATPIQTANRIITRIRHYDPSAHFRARTIDQERFSIQRLPPRPFISAAAPVLEREALREKREAASDVGASEFVDLIGDVTNYGTK